MTRSKLLERMTAAAMFLLVPLGAAADEMTYTYNLASGACKIFAMPAANIPVHVMGQYTNVNDSGMADLTMKWDGPNHVLQWMGIDYASSAIIRAKSAVTGTHIAYLDAPSGGVVLEVQNPSHFKVCSAFSGTTVHGTITLIW